MKFELASAADLGRMQAAAAEKPKRRSWMGRRGANPEDAAARERVHPRCPEGKRCRECETNRKWEAIFKEKFEDATYYMEESASRNSSFAAETTAAYAASFIWPL